MEHSVADNWQLESFMREFGILMPTPFEELQEADNLDERDICMAKGYFRSPYDENGEVLF